MNALVALVLQQNSAEHFPFVTEGVCQPRMLCHFRQITLLLRSVLTFPVMLMVRLGWFWDQRGIWALGSFNLLVQVSEVVLHESGSSWLQAEPVISAVCEMSLL